MKREPKTVYLKRLGEASYVPDELFLELAKFNSKFGIMYKKDIKQKFQEQLIH